MEIAHALPIDTTENWKKSGAALADGELAIEAGESGARRLLVGDGRPVGPDVARLRAGPEFAGLPQGLGDIPGLIAEEARAREEADEALGGRIALLAPEGLDDIPGMFAEEARAREETDEALKTQFETQREAALADQVKGMGRDLMKALLGISFATLATQAQRDEAIAQVMAELRRRCNNNGEIDGTGIPDFRGLAVGDYLDGLDLSGITAPPGGQAPAAFNSIYANNRIVIAGFNFYKNAGNVPNAKNHIVFMFEGAIATGQMNPTNDNTGGYAASAIRAWLEGANGDGAGPFATALNQRLGGCLYTIRKYEGNKDAPAWNTYTVFLPSEIELYGQRVTGSDILSTTQRFIMPAIQLPVFRSMEMLCKTINGVKMNCWTSSAYAYSNALFCHASGIGYAACNNASVAQGLSPVFCVA
jgi:hypothetical protein